MASDESLRVSRASRTETIRATCALSARPLPATAVLISAGLYSAISMFATRQGRQQGTSSLRQHNERAAVEAVKRASPDGYVWRVAIEQAHSVALRSRPICCGTECLAGQERRPKSTASRLFALRFEQCEAGVSTSGIQTQDQQRVLCRLSQSAPPIPRGRYRNWPRRAGRRRCLRGPRGVVSSLGSLIRCRVDAALRQHGELLGHGLDATPFELVEHRAEVLWSRVDFVGLLLDRDVVGCQLEGQVDEAFLAHRLLVDRKEARASGTSRRRSRSRPGCRHSWKRGDGPRRRS